MYAGVIFMTKTATTLTETSLRVDALERNVEDIQNAIRRAAQDKSVSQQLLASLAEDVGRLRSEFTSLKNTLQSFLDAGGTQNSTMNIRKY